MDFGLALTFQFKDPDWVRKLLLASLIALIPVIGWIFVFGWSLEVARRVIKGDAQSLPEIDLARDLVRGLEGFIINLVYNLPAIAVSAGMTLILIFTTAIFKNNGSVEGIWILTYACIIPLAILYGLAMTLVIAAAYGNFLAKEQTLSAGFQLNEVLALVRKAPVAYFLVLVGQFLCGFIAIFGLVACIIGVVVTMTYTTTVMGHLYGQAYREANL
jgi:hypothetical protein